MKEKPKILKFKQKTTKPKKKFEDLVFTATEMEDHIVVNCNGVEIKLSPKQAAAVGFMLIIAAKNVHKK